MYNEHLALESNLCDLRPEIHKGKTYRFEKGIFNYIMKSIFINAIASISMNGIMYNLSI